MYNINDKNGKHVWIHFGIEPAENLDVRVIMNMNCIQFICGHHKDTHNSSAQQQTCEREVMLMDALTSDSLSWLVVNQCDPAGDNSAR